MPPVLLIIILPPLTFLSYISLLNLKFTPNQCFKKMTVTDADAANEYDSLNAINTPPFPLHTHPIITLPQTLLTPLRKIRSLRDNYLMVRNILLLKVKLLSRALIAKLLLSNE